MASPPSNSVSHVNVWLSTHLKPAERNSKSIYFCIMNMAEIVPIPTFPILWHIFFLFTEKNPYKNHLSYSIFLYFCFLRTQQKSDYCSERLISRSLYCEYSDIYLDISWTHFKWIAVNRNETKVNRTCWRSSCTSYNQISLLILIRRVCLDINEINPDKI